MFSPKYLFILFILLIIEHTIALNSSEICFKNILHKENCGRIWNYECGKNYCMTNKNACDNFNDIEQVVKINEM